MRSKPAARAGDLRRSLLGVVLAKFSERPTMDDVEMSIADMLKLAEFAGEMKWSQHDKLVVGWRQRKCAPRSRQGI